MHVKYASRHALYPVPNVFDVAALIVAARDDAARDTFDGVALRCAVVAARETLAARDTFEDAARDGVFDKLFDVAPTRPATPDVRDTVVADARADAAPDVRDTTPDDERDATDADERDPTVGTDARDAITGPAERDTFDTNAALFVVARTTAASSRTAAMADAMPITHEIEKIRVFLILVIGNVSKIFKIRASRKLVISG